MTTSRKTLRDAAAQVLRERGPLHYRELTKEILSRGLASSSSRTPAATINAVLAVNIKRHGKHSQFVRVRPGVFDFRGNEQGLSLGTSEDPEEKQESEVTADLEEETDTEKRLKDRVRIPLFPLYEEVRHLLRIWPGWQRKQVTALRTKVCDLSGTPQNTVDWTDPDRWIQERLHGDDLNLAKTVWEKSDRTVNPRHIYGHWLLTQKYKLLEEDALGTLRLTEQGRDFVENPGGETEVALDEAEGLLKILALVAENGPTRLGGILEEWGEFLTRRSPFGTISTFRDTLVRRLANLREREFVLHKGRLYSITETGLAYLERAGDEDTVSSEEQPELRTLLSKQKAAVRESLFELLLEMDPVAFEHLIKQLLEGMDYQNVEVTAKSGDGGVDVVADIELGITSVREVVQAKRHRRAVQRKDLDALRGSLYRFDAVRGTIITTSRFAKGTHSAAFATGAAPITLIDGEKLVDLLIEHGVGVRKRAVELLEVDPDAFAESEPQV